MVFAAGFSKPLLRREEGQEGGESRFDCRSTGGFPEPRVHWLINHTAEPPEGSVTTVTVRLPGSHLYNVSSRLTANISEAWSVSCTVENALLNESSTSTSRECDGALWSPGVSDTSASPLISAQMERRPGRWWVECRRPCGSSAQASAWWSGSWWPLEWATRFTWTGSVRGSGSSSNTNRTKEVGRPGV